MTDHLRFFCDVCRSAYQAESLDTATTQGADGAQYYVCVECVNNGIFETWQQPEKRTRRAFWNGGAWDYEPITTARCVDCGKPAELDGIRCDNCFIKLHSMTGPTTSAARPGE